MHVRARLKFLLERLIQRGTLYQLLFIASLIALIAALGGLLAWILTDHFAGPAQAVWWAFLRLTDPGYLGDDEGTALRVISTAVTVLGYVLFMGSLIAIMTQWLTQTMRTLESGLTPISIEGHILVLGWTNRTAAIVNELVLSEGRVERFLARRNVGRLNIVVLAEHVTPELRQELLEQMRFRKGIQRVILRSGSSLRIEHLRRVDFSRAAAIIIPGSDYAMEGGDATDTHVIKTLMTISKYDPSQKKLTRASLVAEVFDINKVHIARQAFQGDLEIIASNRFISRLIAQNIHQPGLSFVYAELLSHRYGNEVYLRACPELEGTPFQNLIGAFDKAVVLGMVRTVNGTHSLFLNPAGTDRLQKDDRLVFVSRDYDETVPSTRKPSTPPRPAPEAAFPVADASARRRILILGWSHKVVALLQEFKSYERERIEIDIFSSVPISERKAPSYPPSRQYAVRQLEGDYTVHAELTELDPASYDSVIFLASDWLDSSEEADARSILGYVLLRSLLEPLDRRPQVIIELVDPSNARLFEHRSGEVIISPTILSHILAHTALRKELSVVFDELFGSSGPEIRFRPVSDFGLEGRPVSFRDIQHLTTAHREIALGVRLKQPASDLRGGLQLNPPPSSQYTFTTDDRIVVLTTPT